MDTIILLSRTLICAISMALTGLFAISFAKSTDTYTVTHILNLGLLVAIGVCLDLCKFLFWRFHARHKAYLALSLALMGFSCVASIAFFVSHEIAAINEAQYHTAEYRAHEFKINQLQKEIEQKEALAATRSNSQYHEQWDKSQTLHDAIHEQTQQLAALIEASDHIGISAARANVPSSGFFTKIAHTLNTSFERVVIIAYSLLAIFIEVSALGLISMASPSTVKDHDVEMSTPQAPEFPLLPPKFDEADNENHKGHDQPKQSPNPTTTASLDQRPSNKIDSIERDIRSGISPPQIRNIIRNYGVDRDTAVRILNQLVETGDVEKRGVRFYLKALPQ